MTPDLELSQFDYPLPTELIAQQPTSERTASRLLHLDRHSHLHDRQFTDFPDLLRPGDLLVFNDTRVIKARLAGHKLSGGKVEVLVERIITSYTVLAHIRSSKSPRAGTGLLLDDTVRATVTGRQGDLFAMTFDEPVLQTLDQHGSTPLPPYITRAADTVDEQRYQTVYADQPGAVAAPTAGLHFDATMLQTLQKAGIQQAYVTLHVGAGTFQPVRTKRISDHVMHSEHYTVPAKTRNMIQATQQKGGRIIAVGTTSARALESAAGAQQPGLAAGSDISGDTRLFITPGYTFQWVDALLTNFHLPQSTLLMMVSALAGMQPIQRAYAHAVESRYRFFSYGDAMFIETP